ncbi:hypothetical protein BDV19DRAFT_390504 [Aspergillus venezuelensis]
MSGLNIVIACLLSAAPESGTLSAAVLLSQILSAFTGIKYGIMVRIASGIPKTVDDDMWLGMSWLAGLRRKERWALLPVIWESRPVKTESTKSLPSIIDLRSFF